MSGGRALQAGDWIASYRIEAISGRVGLGRPELIQALEAVLASSRCSRFRTAHCWPTAWVVERDWPSLEGHRRANGQRHGLAGGKPVALIDGASGRALSYPSLSERYAPKASSYRIVGDDFPLAE